MIHVVIGLPGAGKTTYVKGKGKYNLAYDLDYLADALSLDRRGDYVIYEEFIDKYDRARNIANKLLEPILKLFNEIENVDTYIIRCAPDKHEMDMFDKYKDNIDFIFIDTDKATCQQRRCMSNDDIDSWINRVSNTMYEVGYRGYNYKTVNNTTEKW